MTTQPSQIVLINGFGVLFVVFNAFGLGLRLPVGKLLAQALAHWKIAVWALVINFVTITLLFIGYLLTIPRPFLERSRSGSVSQRCVQGCRSLPSLPG
jgi:BASS family bile acid:Na+ symporter